MAGGISLYSVDYDVCGVTYRVADACLEPRERGALNKEFGIDRMITKYMVDLIDCSPDGAQRNPGSDSHLVT
jgi:hypothetical protein